MKRLSILLALCACAVTSAAAQENKLTDKDLVGVIYAMGQMFPDGFTLDLGTMRQPTEGLMVSIPRLDTPADERLDAIPGAVPHPLNLPKGCKFGPRCKYCDQRCVEEEPEMKEVMPGQFVRCFHAEKEERHAKLAGK